MQNKGYFTPTKSKPSFIQTPGTLVFKPTAQNNLIMSLEDDLSDKARMSYRIDTLYFG